MIFRTVPNHEFFWGLKNTGAWYKPTQVVGNGGKITPTANQEFERNAELISLVNGKLFYMGTFKTMKRSTVSIRDFQLLADAVSAPIEGRAFVSH